MREPGRYGEIMLAQKIGIEQFRTVPRTIIAEHRDDHMSGPEIAGKATGTPVLHPRWRRAIEESRLFGPVDVRTYDWEQTYSAVEYTELLQTHSDHRTLPPARLPELLDAVATIIERHDDELRHPYRTELWLSRSTTQ